LKDELSDIQADHPGMTIRYWTQDETRLGLKTLVGKRLTLTGVKPVVTVQWPRQAVWLYGAVEPSRGERFFWEYSHLDSRCFEDFLHQFSRQYPTSLNVIQVDGAPAHIDQNIDIPDNIILLFQPPHSPELNPTERVWEDLKVDLKGESFANLDELRAALREVLSYMTPEWIASLTQYDFIMNALSAASIA
jgi:hypothetical protein